MMIGDQAVGKTALLVRYTEDDFSESVLPTIGIDFKVKV
jgi:GTPase SAR1 family protein